MKSMLPFLPTRAQVLMSPAILHQLVPSSTTKITRTNDEHGSCNEGTVYGREEVLTNKAIVLDLLRLAVLCQVTHGQKDSSVTVWKDQWGLRRGSKDRVKIEETLPADKPEVNP